MAYAVATLSRFSDMSVGGILCMCLCERNCNCLYFLLVDPWTLLRKVLKEIPLGDLHPNQTVHASQEAQLLSQLHHPAILTFYSSFLERDSFCIITEYCQVNPAMPNTWPMTEESTKPKTQPNNEHSLWKTYPTRSWSAYRHPETSIHTSSRSRLHLSEPPLQTQCH